MCKHDHTLLQADRLWCKDCRTFIPLEHFIQRDEDWLAIIAVLGLNVTPVVDNVIPFPTTKSPTLTPAG